MNKEAVVHLWASLVVQSVKNLPVMWETWVLSFGWKDPLEEGMATHSSIHAWRIPWTEELGGLQSRWSQRVGHDWAAKNSTEQHSKNIYPYYFTTSLFYNVFPSSALSFWLINDSRSSAFSCSPGAVSYKVHHWTNRCDEFCISSSTIYGYL